MICERFTIVPSPESFCPEEVTGGSCFTLTQYASNSSLGSELDNITLELQPGSHNLESPLLVPDISSFTMRGMLNVTLCCVQRFAFSATKSVYLVGINFINCGGHNSIVESHIHRVKSFILEDSTFQTNGPFYISSSSSVLITNSVFTHSQIGVLMFTRSPVVIRNCTFSSNVQTSRTSQGGVVVADQSSVTVENSIFKGNHMYGDYGSGAICGDGKKLTIVNSTFINNSAAGRLSSGALDLTYESVLISGSTFVNNVGRDRGAVYISGRRNSVTIINQSSFINNTVTDEFKNGGAVYVSADRSSVTVKQSTFMSNNATSDGGALFFIVNASSIVLDQSTFINNTGGNLASGGAVDILGYNQSVTVKQSVFESNSGGSGGAMVLRGDYTTISINQSMFTNNMANQGGGAVFVFYFEQSNNAVFVITNSVFVYNSASRCGVLEMFSSTRGEEQSLYSRTVRVDASVFMSNGGTRDFSVGGVMCLRNTNISVLNSNFSHNSVANNAGVLQVGDSTVTVESSFFDNNTAGEDGGVIYGSNFTGSFNQTVFTNNRAGDNGGVMYVINSQVTIHDSTIGFNEAVNRGGAVAIFRGVLEIGETNIHDNGARLGGAISACSSEVTLSDHLFVSVDSTSEKCTLYATEESNKATSYVHLPLLHVSISIITMTLIVMISL